MTSMNKCTNCRHVHTDSRNGIGQSFCTRNPEWVQINPIKHFCGEHKAQPKAAPKKAEAEVKPSPSQ